MAASYLRSTTIPLSGLKRLAVKPSVGTTCLVARRTKASLAQDGQQQLLAAHLEKADPAVFDIIERVRVSD
ncbi:hypothetical protein THARTR1_10103 [Trichoderma harzianum]|uniref:Uncharacterized protein n=1 Tax=Trichoderma harzianum TaxID=5544 RepID=A0A2K0TUG8_TRIHA|nr:hypothetical protein THARTR1_10103 [Trichoderma harzianum]